MLKEIVLPEISENVNEAEVVKVLVSAGDAVEAEQSIMELETQKAIFEIPSPGKGTIREILVKEGDTVTVGQVLVKLEIAEKSKEKKKQEDKNQEEKQKENIEEENKSTGSQSVKTKKPAVTSGPDKQDLRGQDITQSGIVTEPAPAAPHVRRLAREIGVDIHQVKGSGPGGRISEADVKAHAKRMLQRGTSVGTGLTPQLIPDLSKWGPVHREPMSKIRSVTAENMATSWISVPLVTQNDEADITELEKARKELAPKIKEAGGHLTITAVLVKITAAALKAFTNFNAIPDLPSQEIIYRHYIHIGIAVDTERGLLVPVIRNADQKSLLEICKELPDLAEKARSRKLMPDALEGACFSISNLGSFGIGHFTPLVSGPQVAILGVAGANQKPVYQDGQWLPRLMLPISLSYDHRLIDGADGARFVRWIVDKLENPFALALEGGF